MGEGTICLGLLKEGDMVEESSELKRDRVCFEEEDSVQQQQGELYSTNKRQAKEASNDDIRSEISNPVLSPVDIAFRDITSNPAKSSSGDRVGSCSVSDDTLSSDEKQSEYGAASIAGSSHSCDDVPSCFVREIPKHLSTTGITKITFKLSKRNEEFCGLPMIEYTWEGSPSNVASSTTLGVKPSKKIVFTNFASNVKNLLLTGILDGARVKYFSTSPPRELQGIIYSGGYLCGCTACDFSKVLSANQFERHAGVKKKHPNKHIYLENGRSVYNLVQELKIAPFDSVEEKIRNLAGSALNEDSFQVLKESFQQDNNMAEDVSNYIVDHSFQSLVSYPGSDWSLDESQSTTPCFPENNYFREKICIKDTRHEHKPKEKKHTSHMFGIGCHKKVSGRGKSKRDFDLHRLLFLPNGLPDGTELAYYWKSKKLLQGYKQGSGIVCSCCDTEISPSQFEAHAGMAGRRQPRVIGGWGTCHYNW